MTPTEAITVGALTSQDDDPAVQMSGKDYGRLSFEDLADILRLSARGKTQREIAAIVGCSQPSVGYALRRLTDSQSTIQGLLKGKALKAVAQWDKAAEKAADRGDHRPARELIEAAYPEMRPQPAHSAGGGGVTINIGAPGQPLALPDITIRSSPTPNTAITSTLSPSLSGDLHRLTPSNTGS